MMLVGLGGVASCGAALIVVVINTYADDNDVLDF